GDNGKVNPDTTITREDMSVMIYRALDIADVNTAKCREFVEFDDFLQVSDYARTAVKRLYEYGVISGVGENMFAPGAAATRAECAKMIYEIVEA
ncbi:MAG: S-layer homology domain-containing protein, partial [Oscillospiraceae bacterium]